MLATGVSQDLVRDRARACDGGLRMPATGFWLGWLGAGLTVSALLVATLRLRHRDRWSALDYALAMLTVLALCFAGFVLYTIYQDARPLRSVCFG
ncbi:MAG TPA: hypothetical protein VLJ59_05605 [Mycobacteriales bacterium]|nr:hypothetical protein [Mycobacteriales bacterium]